VELGVPTLWPVTPAEYASWEDADQVQKLLEAYLEVQRSSGGVGGGHWRRRIAKRTAGAGGGLWSKPA